MVYVESDAKSILGCNIASGIIIEKIVEAVIRDVTLYVNAYTLYRNFINCINGKADEKIKILKNNYLFHRDLIPVFIEDTATFIEAAANNGIDVIIYLPDYKTVKNKYKNWKDIKLFKGLRRKVLETQEDAVAALIEPFNGIFETVPYKLPFTSKDRLYLITHIPVDILSYQYNKNVLLAESHTGELKDLTRWYSKYRPISKYDLSILPFNEFLLQILGDKEFIDPYKIDVRKLIYNIALEKGWNSYTTQERVENTIKMKDPVLYNELRRRYVKLY